LIRIYLLLLIVLIAYFGLRSFRKSSPDAQKKSFRTIMLGLGAIFILICLATGKLNWLFALIGVGIASFFRFLPLLLRYAPLIRRLWFEFIASKQDAAQGQKNTGSSGNMTKSEAYEVLGLKIGASESEIIDAHRKLMQKIHPDRGGSDYLAAKINLAKKMLLKK
jgi:DnaJ domain